MLQYGNTRVKLGAGTRERVASWIFDAAKLREVTNAVEKIAKALEASYFRWGELSDEIDKVKTKLGIEA